MLAQPANIILQLDQDVADQTWVLTTTVANHSKRKLGVVKLLEKLAEKNALAKTQAIIHTELFGKK